jgi:hypothetical protein
MSDVLCEFFNVPLLLGDDIVAEADAQTRRMQPLQGTN